jgi:hypothetical protein
LSLKEISQLRKKERSFLMCLCIDDFSFMHDALKLLRYRKIPHSVVEPGSVVEGPVDCLILEPGLERPVFSSANPVIIEPSRDAGETIDTAVSAIMGVNRPELLLIGIDPGKRPGMAFLADGVLVSIYRSTGPNDIIERIHRGRRAYHPRSLLVRLGNGDPETRDPILKRLIEEDLLVELVDESRTTTTRRFRDENAAVLIGNTRGEPVH